MNIRILSASIFALGLIASSALAEGSSTSTNGRGCPDFPIKGGDFIDCVDGSANSTSNSYGFAVGTQERVGRSAGSIGDFIDETNQEKNQRSSNR
jgi:hypothetical protein